MNNLISKTPQYLEALNVFFSNQQDINTQTAAFHIYQASQQTTHDRDILCQRRRDCFNSLFCVACTKTYSI